MYQNSLSGERGLYKTMTSQFRQLYRELSQASPSAICNDFSYKDSRRDVMQILGHDVGKLARVHVRAPVHHGKAARQRQHEKRQHAITHDHKEESRKLLAIHNQLQETNRLKDVTAKMAVFLQEKQPVPRKLLVELLGDEAMNEGGPRVVTSKGMGAASSSSPSSPAPAGGPGPDSPAPSSWHIPKRKKVLLKDGPESPRGSDGRPRLPPMKGGRTKSDNQWSQQEREKLNDLYNDIPRPGAHQKHLELWDNYYYSLGTRFRAFFPRRQLPEITAKLEEMITKRQMKEKGEKVYWSQVMLKPEPPTETFPKAAR